jgi:YYY domain-containing protein
VSDPTAGAPRPGDRRVLVPLLAVLALGAFLRFDGLRWDAACPGSAEAASEVGCTETHLHPDERFLTMVATAVEPPGSLAEHLDTARSPLNPHNRGHGFFAYGTFPLLVVDAVAEALGLGGYDRVHLVGRALSATWSTLSVLLVFLLGRRLWDDLVGLTAALLLALAVLPIQAAHFFTVEAMTTALATLGLLAALAIAERGRWREHAWFGVVLGMAVATKVSVAPLALVAVVAALSRRLRPDGAGVEAPERRERVPLLAGLALAAAVSLAVFRLLMPMAFVGPGLFDVALNPAWLANLREVGELMGGWRDFPPGHQWAGRTPLWFPWKNLVLFGMGPALGLAAWAGWAFAGWRLLRRGDLRPLVPWTWVTLVFLHQGTQWVKAMRYLLPIYPCLALLAAWLLVGLLQRARREPRWRVPARALVAVVVLATVAWAVAFTSIYRRPHSRIEASRWLYAQAPEGASIAHEAWDDALPVPLDGYPGMARFRGVTLHPYAEDSPQKIDDLLASLADSDYLVVSSNRVYDSVARLPQRFPATLRYYDLLFSGELGFERVAELTSYPTLFGLRIPDQGAEEAFTVYDHPRVQIFRRTERFDVAAARARLEVDWDAVVQVTPREASRYRTLLFDEEARARRRAAGTFTAGAGNGEGGLFPPRRSATGALLLWMLGLQAVALAAFPLVTPALRRLDDRGYLAAHTAGVLLLAWVAWLGARLGVWSFTPATLRALALGLLLAGGVAAWAQRRDLLAFVRERRALLLGETALFWTLFLAMVAVRALDPDLWHPQRGGEKPMDLAMLGAVVRSAEMPPYDPWFAGGVLNYYYFGFVMSGALALLARVPPALAYNLAVPTFFALTAAGVFVLVRHLARAGGSRDDGGTRRSLRTAGWGLLGVVAVTVAGNLGTVRLLVERVASLSDVDPASRLPWLPEAVRFAHGLGRMALGARPDIPANWWFWSPSRMIPAAPGETAPITEFPAFTFLFADLHAHAMALPLMLLVLLLVTAHSRGREVAEGAARAPGGASAGRRGVVGEAVGLGLLALTVGALAATNTWDHPTALAMVLAGLVVLETRTLLGSAEARRLPALAAAAGRAGWRFALVLAGSRLAFLPFHHDFVNAYGRLQLWEGSRTPLSAFLWTHGLFLLPLAVWLAVERRPLETLGAALRGGLRRASSWLRHRRRRRRWSAGYWSDGYRVLVRRGPERWDREVEGWALFGALGLALVGWPVEALLVALGGLAAGVLLDGAGGLRRRWIALFTLAGCGLAGAVEHFVVSGDIGRMNTVFKVYLQVWLLWGSASVAALASLSRGWLAGGALATDGSGSRPRAAFRLAWAALFAGACLYPLRAVPARVADRFDPPGPRGLDGRAFVATARYGDAEGPVELRWDGEAIDWLLARVEGSPTILEASIPPYRWGSRFSVHTGLPTVLGWDWHQRQQRAAVKGDPVGRRLEAVAAMYGGRDVEEALRAMREHGVELVVVGELERLYYPAEGLAKFEGDPRFPVVYRNQGTTIYAVSSAGEP